MSSAPTAQVGVLEAEADLRQPEGSAQPPLLSLLRAYRDLLEYRPPSVVWLPRGAGAGRVIRTPALGWLVHYMVKIHVARSLAALERTYGIRIAVAAEGASETQELERVRTFRKSVPPLLIGGVGITSVFIGVVSLVLAAFKRLADALPLASWIHAAEHAIVPESGTSADRVIGAIIIASLALAVVMAAPVGSFRLKRALFNGHPLLDPQRRPARSDLALSAGAYAVERRAFAQLNSRPPRELPLDLAVSMLMAVVVAGVTVNVAITAGLAATQSDWYVMWFAIELAVLLALFLWFALARNARALRGRASLEYPQPAIGPPAALGARRRAQLLDLPAVLALSAALMVPVLVCGAAWGVLLVAPVLAASAYAAACLFGPFHLRGSSYGKSRSQIAVLRSNGTPAEPWRVIVRDGLLKWGVFGPAALLVLFIPTALDLIWPLLDERKRALHDVIAGTVVVQAERRHMQ